MLQSRTVSEVSPESDPVALLFQSCSTASGSPAMVRDGPNRRSTKTPLVFVILLLASVTILFCEYPFYQNGGAKLVVSLRFCTVIIPPLHSSNPLPPSSLSNRSKLDPSISSIKSLHVRFLNINVSTVNPSVLRSSRPNPPEYNFFHMKLIHMKFLHMRVLPRYKFPHVKSLSDLNFSELHPFISHFLIQIPSQQISPQEITPFPLISKYSKLNSSVLNSATTIPS